MSAPQPEVEVSADAREALLAHLAADPVRNRFIRIHVGRGWGGYSYQLSLDETADPQRDEIIEQDGLRFVAEVRQRHLLAGLRIEVQQVSGRTGLVAWNTASGPGGC